MHTVKSLKKDFEKIGLLPTDTVLVHTSVKAVGTMENGVDTLIDALMTYLNEGLLLVPTHTWRQINEENPIFNPETEQPCIGIMPEIFRHREGVKRSWHPTHSLAAYGKPSEVDIFTEGAEQFDTPAPPNGWIGHMLDRKAKVLLIGVNHNRNTFIHGIEEIVDVPDRMTIERQPLKVKVNGQVIDSPQRRHYGSTSEKYNKLYQPFLDYGVAVEGKIGDATSQLCDTVKMTEFVTYLLNQEISLFSHFEPIPESYLPKDRV